MQLFVLATVYNVLHTLCIGRAFHNCNELVLPVHPSCQGNVALKSLDFTRGLHGKTEIKTKTFASRPRPRPRLLLQDQDQDYFFGPRGASRPRPGPRGQDFTLHHTAAAVNLAV
jgi:hypothetical protein